MGINTYLMDLYTDSIRRKAIIGSVFDIHWTIILILFEFIGNSCIVFRSEARATVTGDCFLVPPSAGLSVQGVVEMPHFNANPLHWEGKKATAL